MTATKESSRGSQTQIRGTGVGTKTGAGGRGRKVWRRRVLTTAEGRNIASLCIASVAKARGGVQRAETGGDGVQISTKKINKIVCQSEELLF